MNDLTTGAEALKKFQETVAEKLRGDIADLLPPDALRAMVERAVEENFFKDREVKEGYHTNRKPSYFVEQVMAKAQDTIRELAVQYVEDNKDVFDKTIKNFLSDHSLMMTMFEVLRRNTLVDIEEISIRVHDRLKQGF